MRQSVTTGSHLRPRRVAGIEGHGPYTWAEAVKRERADILRMKPPHNVDGVTKNTVRKVEVA